MIGIGAEPGGPQTHVERHALRGSAAALAAGCGAASAPTTRGNRVLPVLAVHRRGALYAPDVTKLLDRHENVVAGDSDGGAGLVEGAQAEGVESGRWKV